MNRSYRGSVATQNPKAISCTPDTRSIHVWDLL
jgi:hypothetical protein